MSMKQAYVVINVLAVICVIIFFSSHKHSATVNTLQSRVETLKTELSISQDCVYGIQDRLTTSENKLKALTLPPTVLASDLSDGDMFLYQNVRWVKVSNKCYIATICNNKRYNAGECWIVKSTEKVVPLYLQ